MNTSKLIIFSMTIALATCWAAAEPCTYCGYHVETLNACYCGTGPFGTRAECGGSKSIKECAHVPTFTECMSRHKTAYFTGGLWEDIEYAPGSYCAGLEYCGGQEFTPINYIGPTTCVLEYFGCN